MTAETATYVYALVRAPEPPVLDDAPRGLADAGPPRVLAVGADRRLVVADAPLARYSAAAIHEGLCDLDWVARRALEHEALVEHLLGRGTLVPFKLFTLFHDDERALADARGRGAELDALLERLAGKREWGVRLLLDADAAAAAAREQAAAASETDAAGAGHAFLLRKKRALDASRELGAELRRRAQALHEELAGRAAEARNRPPLRGEGRLALDASYLVREDGEAAFHAALDARRAELAAAGLEFALTGPWPAYNFVEPTA